MTDKKGAAVDGKEINVARYRFKHLIGICDQGGRLGNDHQHNASMTAMPWMCYYLSAWHCAIKQMMGVPLPTLMRAHVLVHKAAASATKMKGGLHMNEQKNVAEWVMPISIPSGQSPLTPDRVEWHVAPRRLLCQAISDSRDWEWWGWRLAARVRGNRIPIYAFFLLLLNSMSPVRMHAWTGTWILGNRGIGISLTSQEDVNETGCSFWDQPGQPVFTVLDCLHKEGGWRRGRARGAEAEHAYKRRE